MKHPPWGQLLYVSDKVTQSDMLHMGFCCLSTWVPDPEIPMSRAAGKISEDRSPHISSDVTPEVQEEHGWGDDPEEAEGENKATVSEPKPLTQSQWHMSLPVQSGARSQAEDRSQPTASLGQVTAGQCHRLQSEHRSCVPWPVRFPNTNPR